MKCEWVALANDSGYSDVELYVQNTQMDTYVQMVSNDGTYYIHKDAIMMFKKVEPKVIPFRKVGDQ